MDPRYNAPKKLNRKAVNQYLKTKVQVADRLELLIITYEELVKAAERKDAEKVKKVADLLINTLDLDHATEFGIGMLRIYKYCIAEADKGKFDHMIQMMNQFIAAWRVLQHSQNKDKED